MLGADGEQAEVIPAFVEPPSWRGEDGGMWVEEVTREGYAKALWKKKLGHILRQE